MGTGEVDKGVVPRAAVTSAFVTKLQTPMLGDPVDADSTEVEPDSENCQAKAQVLPSLYFTSYDLVCMANLIVSFLQSALSCASDMVSLTLLQRLTLL